MEFKYGSYFRLFVVLLFMQSGVSVLSQSNKAIFSYVEYTGKDHWFDKKIDPDNQYLNPIISGFYPDPSICKKGDDYFLVTSTFSYYPGVPIFHSRDLVNWSQIGYVLNRPSQLQLDGFHTSSGIYAPAIEYNSHNDTFYLVTTCLGGIGNFFVKTKDPFVGNWSDPILLPDVKGIDPSFFFDEDGTGYLLHNGRPEGGSTYSGHQAIWLHRFDTKLDKTVGTPRMIVNGGGDLSLKPFWIEGPHLYKVSGKYYLICAEGGTDPSHSEVVFRADDLSKEFISYTNNPILTQRDLAVNRRNKITCAGHADIIQTSDGKWYAVFLACRPYEKEHFFTGRETFLLPVTWENGFPVILEKGKEIPIIGNKPGLQPLSDNKITGNFVWRDNFTSRELSFDWSFVRTPRLKWWSTGSRGLILDTSPVDIVQNGNPAYLARRIKNNSFDFLTELTFEPQTEQEFSGICCFQNDKHNLIFGKSVQQGIPVILFRKVEKEKQEIMVFPIHKDHQHAAVTILVEVRDGLFSFVVSYDGEKWQRLVEDIDAAFLSTDVAGGFLGATIGPFATSALTNSYNSIK